MVENNSLAQRIRIGEKFSSFEDFQKARKEFQNVTNQHFYYYWKSEKFEK